MECGLTGGWQHVKELRSDRNEYVHQKHPVSAVEVRGWLENHGFAVERTFGDRAGNPYTDASPRAIFWARKHY